MWTTAFNKFKKYTLLKGPVALKALWLKLGASDKEFNAQTA